MMDTKTLVVGQKVSIFGCGYFEGTVVRITPDGVEVVIQDGDFARFDKDGKETEDSRYRRIGGLPTMPPEWQAWELRQLDAVNLTRNVSIWLIKFLREGEKPADEVFKEAEKRFGDAGDAVREASDSLGVSKRQWRSRRCRSSRWIPCARARTQRAPPAAGARACRPARPSRRRSCKSRRRSPPAGAGGYGVRSFRL